MLAKPTFPILRKSHLLARDLVGAWVMSEGAGLSAYNIANQLQNGTLTGGPAWVNGPTGSALSFDGVGTSVNCGLGALNQLTTISVVALIYPTGSGGGAFGRILDTSGASTTNGFRFNFDSSGVTNALQFAAGTTLGGTSISVSNALTLNVWQQVAATCIGNGDVAKLYVNSIPVALSTGTAITLVADATLTAVIGSRSNDSTRIFAGNIAHVFVWKRVLTPDEMTLLNCNPYAMLNHRMVLKSVAAFKAAWALNRNKVVDGVAT